MGSLDPRWRRTAAELQASSGEWQNVGNVIREYSEEGGITEANRLKRSVYSACPPDTHLS